jgi:hypothetical protein
MILWHISTSASKTISFPCHSSLCLLLHQELKIMCSERDLQWSFTGKLWTTLKVTLNAGALDSDSTETSFHSFWDDNIWKIITLILTPDKSSGIASQEPDFGALLQGVRTFSGGENPSITQRGILKMSYLINWHGHMIPHPRFLVSKYFVVALNHIILILY